LSLLKEHNIGVLVRGAVAKGMLIDKPAQEYLGYSEQETARARSLVKDISNKDLTAAQVALQFALRGPAVYSVAAGMRTMEQLEENTAKEVASLTEAQYQQLYTALPPNQYQAHR
jgi:aryl-alcohol dehydrogenase-like predicted oxidoreductase